MNLARTLTALAVFIAAQHSVNADVIVDFGPGAVQSGTISQTNVSTLYTDAVFSADVTADATEVSEGFTRAPNTDAVTSLAALSFSDGTFINDLEDDLIFSNGVAGSGVNITISGLLTGQQATFEAWFADTRATAGAGAVVDQEVFLNGNSQGLFAARFTAPSPSFSTTLTGNGSDIVIRVQEANALDQLRFNGFALLEISGVPEPGSISIIALSAIGMFTRRRRLV